MMAWFYLLGCMAVWTAGVQETGWSADDDTFDPSIASVVIGNRSWIGDPSPFVHAGSGRTGYTYVNPTHYDGMPPAVQLSLMVPLEVGDTQPVGGGMLMTDAAQTQTLIDVLGKAIQTEKHDDWEAVQLTTTLKQSQWSVGLRQEGDGVVIELIDAQNDPSHVYLLSVNASRKLIGALEHALQQVR